MTKKKPPRPFNPKLSLRLDRAVAATERGSRWGRLKKRLLEWWIWGGEVMRVNYHEYIQSKEWREKAEQAKKEVGYRCQVCNASKHEQRLDAHHRTYANLGNEQPGDITVLCAICHELFSTNGQLTNVRRIRESDFEKILSNFWGRMFWNYGVDDVGRWQVYETEKKIADEMAGGDWKQFDRLMKVVIRRIPKLEEVNE